MVYSIWYIVYRVSYIVYSIKYILYANNCYIRLHSILYVWTSLGASAKRPDRIALRRLLILSQTTVRSKCFPPPLCSVSHPLSKIPQTAAYPRYRRAVRMADERKIVERLRKTMSCAGDPVPSAPKPSAPYFKATAEVYPQRCTSPFY